MPFDVMVLDLRMPEMDGIELIQQAGQIRQPLSIIVLTDMLPLKCYYCREVADCDRLFAKTGAVA